MIFDDNDVQSAALCAWKEARGDVAIAPNACEAVLWVISNRAWDWRETVHQVVYGKNQYTSMSVPSDPEFNLEPKPGDTIYAACLAAAPAILRREGTDPTNGAHYYENMATGNSGWFLRNVSSDATNHPQKAVIGHHTFFL